MVAQATAVEHSFWVINFAMANDVYSCQFHIVQFAMNRAKHTRRAARVHKGRPTSQDWPAIPHEALFIATLVTGFTQQLTMLFLRHTLAPLLDHRSHVITSTSVNSTEPSS